jgi:hypothetical protein
MITYLSQVRANVIKLSVQRLPWYYLNSKAEGTLPNLWDLCTEPLVLLKGSPYSLLRAVTRLYQKSDTKNVRNSNSLCTLLETLWADLAGKASWVHTHGYTLRLMIKHIWDSSNESDEYPGAGDIRFASFEETISRYSQGHCFFEARSSDQKNNYFAYGSPNLVKGDQIILAERLDMSLNLKEDNVYRGYVIRHDQRVQPDLRNSSQDEISGSHQVVGQAWLLIQTATDFGVKPEFPMSFAPRQDAIYLS